MTLIRPMPALTTLLISIQTLARDATTRRDELLVAMHPKLELPVIVLLNVRKLIGVFDSFKSSERLVLNNGVEVRF